VVTRRGVPYADQAGDLAAFADRFELEKFVLVGTSMGGIIAMTYTAGASRPARGAGDQRHRARCGGGQPAHHRTGRSRPNEFASLEDAIAYRLEFLRHGYPST
jgi:hypothetical protein